MDLELKDKVALITGGSKGIGLAVAKGLAKEKVSVILCSRNKSEVELQASQIKDNYGVETLGLACDVTDASDISNSSQKAIQQFGGIDILINNAGIGSNEKIMEATDEKWMYYWNLHVMAAVRLSRLFAPTMKKRGGGVIINNASICARQPLDYEPIYNVTKSALVMLSKSLSEELIKDGIRVNCVNPGLIQTSAWEDAAKDYAKNHDIGWQQYLDQIAREKTPIGRFATPEELADFFIFLCSPRASYCVGSTYYVDGGWLKTTT
ncbi:MAG TPA: SDR family oxidoreductase [Balneolales bacterium]|nr:SDR family oxidoreductase [Balneolales bacterium]